MFLAAFAKNLSTIGIRVNQRLLVESFLVLVWINRLDLCYLVLVLYHNFTWSPTIYKSTRYASQLGARIPRVTFANEGGSKLASVIWEESLFYFIFLFAIYLGYPMCVCFKCVFQHVWRGRWQSILFFIIIYLFIFFWLLVNWNGLL